jgi:hypothetical protein
MLIELNRDFIDEFLGSLPTETIFLILGGIIVFFFVS